MYKKNVDNYFRLRFRGIAKHLTCYIRVKNHAIGVSIRAFTLACFFNLANFGNKNLSGRFCLYFFILAHRRYFLLRFYIICNLHTAKILN